MRSERLLAAAHASGERGWLRLAVCVFEHAADCDLHGAMQGIRHGPERAFMAVPDGLANFGHEMEVLSRHPASWDSSVDTARTGHPSAAEWPSLPP